MVEGDRSVYQSLLDLPRTPPVSCDRPSAMRAMGRFLLVARHDRKLREGRFHVVTANVLATGCSGFLRRHCMEALVRNGFRVHAVTRSPHADAADGVTWHNLDLHVPGAAEG